MKKLIIVTLLLLFAPLFSGQAESYYGAPWGADELSNLTIGEWEGREVSYRFRAENTGTTQDLRLYWVFAPGGYYAGDGGDILIEIQTDDGTADHLPSGNTIASYIYYDPLTEAFPALPISANLVEGELYHIKFTNIDSNPVANFVSINDLFSWQVVLSPMHPTVSQEDLGVLLKRANGWNWELKEDHAPIFDLTYTDNFSQGQGYIDPKSSQIKTIDSNNRIKQTFINNDQNRLLKEVSVRVEKIDGNADLTMRLEDFHGHAYDGTLIEEGAFPTSYIVGANWVTYAFSQPILLEQDNSYDLILESDGGEYTMNPIQEGEYYGFDQSLTFGDGVMYYDDGSGWEAFDFAGDMQFYFTIYEDRDNDGYYENTDCDDNDASKYIWQYLKINLRKKK